MKITSGLYDWQIPYAQQAINSLRKNKAVLDASITGAGKTFVALAVIKELGIPFIVISPKAVMHQWTDICREHFEIEPLLVINYESMKIGKTPYYKAMPEGSKNKSGSNMEWIVPKDTVIIFDEAHKTKNATTANAKLLQDAVAQSISVYMLSATIGENPLKMKSVGEALKLFSNYWAWATQRGVVKNRFGMEFVGGEKDMEKIHQDIFGAKKGIRVSKDVLASKLPPLRNEVKFIDFSKKSQINKVYQALEDEVYDILNEKELSAGERSGHILAIRTRARQQTELLKVPDLVEISDDLIEEGNSVAIFVNYKETIKMLAKGLKTDCIIMGGGQNKQSQDRFNAGESKIILISIKAGGTGISLHDTVGEHPRIALINPTDSAQDLVQSVGRIWRAGGKSPAQAWYMFAKGTIEQEIGQNVKAKINNLNALNDGMLREPFLKDVKFTESLTKDLLKEFVSYFVKYIN